IPDESPFFLDIPEVNPQAVELVQRHNMKVVFETARMYRGMSPELPLGNIYGVTTFELG
ncbi:MAG: GNAT family N-acetyltransferase, partial [Geobacteraceae bacterium]|nr:GNAT family N-acetyltransferase [Geobacteraceae bacterium]